MKRRQRLRLAFTIHNGDALFVVVVGLSGLARRLAESRLSALGPTAGHWRVIGGKWGRCLQST